MVKFLCRCDGNGLFFEAMRSRCVLDKRHNRFWCDYLDLTIVDNVFRFYGLSRFLVGSQYICRFFIVSRWFWRFLRYFHICWFFKFTIIIICKFFLLNHLGPMFFRFIDLSMRLFPMAANHWSSDAMFAMYRSSLPPNWSAFENFEGFCDIL